MNDLNETIETEDKMETLTKMETTLNGNSFQLRIIIKNFESKHITVK